MMPAVLSSTINRGIWSLTDRIKRRNPFEPGGEFTISPPTF
jgi:putative component of membrane protein insertase Oxa1/YidC/SpoIIIJ protein YidD